MIFKCHWAPLLPSSSIFISSLLYIRFHSKHKKQVVFTYIILNIDLVITSFLWALLSEHLVYKHWSHYYMPHTDDFIWDKFQILWKTNEIPVDIQTEALPERKTHYITPIFLSDHDSMRPSSGQTRPSPLALWRGWTGAGCGCGGLVTIYLSFLFPPSSHPVFYLLHFFSCRKPRPLSPPLHNPFAQATWLFDLNRFLLSVFGNHVIAIYTLSPKPICAN